MTSYENKSDDRAGERPVSSAELTALWRSLHPSISHDNLSIHMVSDKAKHQSDVFIEMHHYPLISRKISARAGYIFNEALHLIRNYHCDSVLSFACGYSLLGLLISLASPHPIHVIDTDLPLILADRQQRLKNLSLSKAEQTALAKVSHDEFDIEQAAVKNIDLSKRFPQCKRPVIILEGITYFLTPNTRDWLIQALKKWHNACIILEYWPENSLEISNKIKASFEIDLKKNFKEHLKSFMLDKHIEDLTSWYDATDISIGEAENELSRLANEEPQLLNPHDYYPIRILTGAPKEKITKPT